MSTLSNWIAVNKASIDALPPTQARTILNLIRTFEKRITTLGFAEAIASFQSHVTDIQNPHNVRFEDLYDMITRSLFNYYQTDYVPNLDSKTDTIIGSVSELQSYINNFPPLLFELMRQCILNRGYQYQDGVGYDPIEPFYLVSDPTPYVIPPPFYVANGVARDTSFDWSGTKTRTFSPTEANAGTIIFNYQIGSSDTNAVWTLSINNLTIAYSQDTQVLTVTPAATAYTSTPATLTATLDRERHAAVSISDAGVTLYYFVNGVFTQTSATFSNASVSITSYALSHDYWDQCSDVTATRHVGFYPLITDPRVVEFLLSSAY